MQGREGCGRGGRGNSDNRTARTPGCGKVWRDCGERRGGGTAEPTPQQTFNGNAKTSARRRQVKDNLKSSPVGFNKYAARPACGEWVYPRRGGNRSPRAGLRLAAPAAADFPQGLCPLWGGGRQRQPRQPCRVGMVGRTFAGVGVGDAPLPKGCV